MIQVQNRYNTAAEVIGKPVENNASLLYWSTDPVTPDEQKRADEIFRWISQH